MPQTIEFDLSRFIKKKGELFSPARPPTSTTPLCSFSAQEYRRKLSAAMKPWPPTMFINIPKSRGYYAMRKYDGEFTYVVFDGEKLISVNPGGTVRVGLPCFAEAEKLLKKAKVKSCVLAGELYATGDIGNRNRVQEIVKLLQIARLQRRHSKRSASPSSTSSSSTARRWRPWRMFLSTSRNGSAKASWFTRPSTSRPTSSTQ